MTLFKAAAIVAAGLVALITSGQATERGHISTLKWVYPLANGDFVLGFDTDSAACTSANTPKYMYVAVGQNGITAGGAQKLYAAALVALSTGKTLSVAFDDATTYCYINRVTVNK